MLITAGILGLIFLIKIFFMATSNKQAGNAGKQRKGDTSRTSSQGQKLASGGRKETDNKGRSTSDIIQPTEDRAIKNTGRKM
jgi:hypothetical protein